MFNVGKKHPSERRKLKKVVGRLFREINIQKAAMIATLAGGEKHWIVWGERTGSRL